jgi:hypothetical protein
MARALLSGLFGREPSTNVWTVLIICFSAFAKPSDRRTGLCEKSRKLHYRNLQMMRQRADGPAPPSNGRKRAAF